MPADQDAGSSGDGDRQPDRRLDRALDLSPTPTAGPVPDGGAPGREEGGSHETPDPLRLCIFATIALLSWLAGPWALAFFAGLGVTGYARARRAGLLRSRCLLGDTRLVLAYLGVLLAVGLVFAARSLGVLAW